MTQYVIDVSLGRVVAAFLQRRAAERYASCALASGLVFEGDEPSEFKLLLEPELAVAVIAAHQAKDEVDLLALLVEDTSVQRFGKYSCEQALMDLFAQPGAAWRLAELMDRIQAPRITIACRLTYLKNKGLLVTERGKDKRYRVWSEPAPQG